LNSLASVFRAPLLCFQYFAASFSKTPGGGISGIDTDLYPKAGRHGFDLHGKPIRPLPQNEVNTVDDEPKDEEPAKSQKPN